MQAHTEKSQQDALSAERWEQLVIFRLAGEFYGVDIDDVNTIIPMQEVTCIPRSPEYVTGVINLRGSIIPVIDLRKRFGLAVSEVTKASRIVVVEAGGYVIGMVVDAVAETLRVQTDSIEPPSPVVASIDSDYLRGVAKQGERLVVLLCLDKVLKIGEIEQLNASANRSKSKQSAAKAA